MALYSAKLILESVSQLYDTVFGSHNSEGKVSVSQMYASCISSRLIHNNVGTSTKREICKNKMLRDIIQPYYPLLLQ